MRRNRLINAFTWALIAVLAVQSYLPSYAFALESGRIQQLAEVLSSYRAATSALSEADVTVRTVAETNGGGSSLTR